MKSCLNIGKIWLIPTDVPKCQHLWWMWLNQSNLARPPKISKKRCSRLLSSKVMLSNQMNTSLLALIRLLWQKKFTIKYLHLTQLNTKQTNSLISYSNNDNHLGKLKLSKRLHSRKETLCPCMIKMRNPNKCSNFLHVSFSARKWTSFTLIQLIGTTNPMTFVNPFHPMLARLNSFIR